MELKRKIVRKMLAIANGFAMILVVLSANTCCIWAFHQPEFPETAKKYIRA